MSEERLTSAEDQWSESASGKRYPTRNHDESSKASGRRYGYEDPPTPKADPRLDRVQSATYRDRRRRSTDEESSDRKVNAPGRARVTSSSDDRFEKVENTSRRASSLRRDVTLDDLERSSSRRDSRRSSFDSDIQVRKTPSRDVTSPRRTPTDVSRDISSRSSSQRRDVSEDLDGVSAKRSSGRSSFESNNQNSRKTTRETSVTIRDIPKTISDPRVAERQRSIEKDQLVRDSSRTVDVQQKKQDSADVKRQEARRSQEDAKATKMVDRTIENASSRKIDAASRMEIPKEEWACEHCTFINKINDRVCVVCCKTKSSALPPSKPDNDLEVAGQSAVPQVQAKSAESSVGDLEKRSNLLKISNSEESGDNGSVKNKGRLRRKISFSFGTKSSK